MSNDPTNPKNYPFQWHLSPSCDPKTENSRSLKTISKEAYHDGLNALNLKFKEQNAEEEKTRET